MKKYYFDLIAFRSGSNFGLPSPGMTTLTRLGPPGSDFQVDSFFDIFYEIDFQGADGSDLDGFVGTTADNDILSTFTPDSGYEIEAIQVNGDSVDTASNYTFNDVMADATISVSFVESS